ncbi:MAG: MT-A70 family methyltransferase [Candidatus Sulfotelmatobacter sp.]
MPPVSKNSHLLSPAQDLLAFLGGRKFGSVLIDPPWRFSNRTGKMAPEHKRLHRYPTMSFDEIAALPVGESAADKSHLYLWCPNALLAEGLNTMKAWGFTYKSNLVWYKVRKDGGPDGRGVGFYFRNVTELVLFGIKGRIRTLSPGRRQVNIIVSRKEEHSKKPDAIYDLVERCSPGPYFELFSRQRIRGWTQWGNEVDSYEAPAYKAYSWSMNPDRSIASPSRLEAADSRQHRLRLLLE